MINSTQMTDYSHYQPHHNHSLNAILYNLSSNTSSNWHRQLSKKKIKAPDSLKSPLAPWQEPIENWKALVTEDVFASPTTSPTKTQQQSKKETTTTTTTSKMPSRRHTMTFTDLNRLSSTLASLNIFSGGSAARKNKQQQLQQQQKQKQQRSAMMDEEYDDEYDEDEEEEVSRLKWKTAVAKSRLTQPVYFKHGPGYDDFGFVSTNELIKVRIPMRILY